MKYILTLLILFIAELSIAQIGFPDFLQGSWKIEDKESYEHWDKLNNSSLKGFSYQLKNGQIAISEYLDISESKSEIYYTATVLNQNQGKGIKFKLMKSDSAFTFENPTHDFPKKISYKKISDHEILVKVTDGKEKGFEYKMQKLFQNKYSGDSSVKNPNYDPALAQKLGADDYGMKNYVLVMLKTGPNQTTDKNFINECFRGHMVNINLLVKGGKMSVAGPLRKNDNTYRGIFILNVEDFEDAKSLLQNDTAIREGLLDYELYKWYGSAALPEYLDFSDKIWKIKH